MQQNTISFFRGAFLRHGPRRFAVMQPQAADRKYDDHSGTLTDSQIAAHLEGRTAYAVPTAQDGLASYLPLDIDAGGEPAARALLDAAQARGLWAFAQVDPVRGRGYVWIPFNDLTSAERLHILGEQLLAEVMQPGWRIENRATAEDTRLPFARHTWTGRRGTLLYHEKGIIQPLTADLDSLDYIPILEQFTQTYRENPTTQLPPPTAPPATSGEPRARNSIELPPAYARTRFASGPSVTIQAYNATTDLVNLLGHYGAKQAKGQGARLYFCPFHTDDHASLLVSKDGDRCKCLSAGSGCPLSAHQNDAFNVFCAGEGLTTTQALRRLNGLPDEPQAPRPIPKSPRKPPQQPNRGESTSPSRPSANTAVRPSQKDSAPLPAPTEEPPTSGLPKSARRIFAYISAQVGDYCRGKYFLARVLDIDPRTVQRSLRRLETEGLLERQQRGRDGQTDIYRVVPARRGSPAEITGVPSLVEQGEGRQLPPTITQVFSITDTLRTERGGRPTPPLAWSLCPLSQVTPSRVTPTRVERSTAQVEH